MNIRNAAVAAVLALFVMTGVALGQRADQNTGGPTKNTLRLTLAEPVEGAAITGSLVRVVVAYNQNAFGSGQGTSFGDPNFPQPRFNVYLDDMLQTTLQGTEANVARLENVAPGSHKVTVVALNVSGEIVDRKEVNITTVAARMPAPRAEVKEKVPPAPAPVPAYEPPAPQPIVEAKPLPTTASHLPLLALAGFALVAAGLLLRLKAH
jgi:hypothetical protein